MIKKFEEYIQEGLWSKGIERSKSGEIRKGDRTDFEKFIDTIEWVDIGHPDYLFSKFDFYEGILPDELFNLKLPNNIKYMDNQDLKWLKKNTSLTHKSLTLPEYDYCKVIEFKSDSESVYFNINFEVDYVTKIDKCDNGGYIDIILFTNFLTQELFITSNKDLLYTIKLLKQK